MLLKHVVKEIEPFALERLRIKTVTGEYSYNSEEYRLHENDEVDEYDIVEDYPNRCMLLRIYPGKKPKEEPYVPQEPEKPLYPGIGM